MKLWLAGMALFTLSSVFSFTWLQRQQDHLSQLTQNCAQQAEQFLHRPGSVWAGSLADPIYSTHYSRTRQTCLIQLDGQARIAPLRTAVDRSEIIDLVHRRTLLLFLRSETDFVLARRVEYRFQGENEFPESSTSEWQGQHLADAFHTRSAALMTE